MKKKWNKLSKNYQQKLFRECVLKWVLSHIKPCNIKNCKSCGVIVAQRGK